MNPRPRSRFPSTWTLFLASLLLIHGAIETRSQTIPPLISYQGVLRSGTGAPVTGAIPSITFSIYPDATDSSKPLWRETQTVLLDANGLFNVNIGTGHNGVTNGAPDLTGVFANGGTLFLELWVGGDTAAILPRQQFLSAPFALLANRALNGVDTDGNLTVTGLASITNLSTVGNATLPNITGPVSINGNLNVTGQTGTGSLTVSNALNVKTLTVGSNITATGSLTASGAALQDLRVGNAANPNTLVVWSTGFVGIGGLPDNTKGLVTIAAGPAENGFVNSDGDSPYYFDSHGKPTKLSGGGPFNVSLYAASGIVSAGFLAVSDARVKSLAGRSSSARDLQTLLGIEITDYTLIDSRSQPSTPQKKVIAQQLEAVYPEAVSRSTDVIPDIYAQGEAKAGWISLAAPPKQRLNAGERVQLITKSGRVVHEVLEASDQGFRVSVAPDGPVFVYGREVNDFRHVDYDAVAMLNVSATQELHRLLQQQQATIEALDKRVRELLARQEEGDARFSALEKRLREASGTVQQASLR